MSPQRVSLSRRDAEALVRLADANRWAWARTGANEAIDRLRSALKPSPKRTASKKERRTEKAKKRAEKNAETAAIREAVFKRARGFCEVPGCGNIFTTFDPGELDHFHGRIRVKQSVESCWAICRADHRAKTDSRPSRAFWLEKFIQHCDRHEIGGPAFTLATMNLAALTLQAEAKEALSNG